MIKNLSIRKFLYNILSKKRLQSKIKTTLNLDTSQQEQNNCYKIIGDNNKIIVIENGVEKDYTNKRINGLEISISGNNNIVRVEMPNVFHSCCFLLENTNNSFLEVKSSNMFDKKNLFISLTHGYNQSVYIGTNTTIERANLVVGECNTSIRIGNDCMFSAGILIFTCDGHTIIDKQTKDIINKPKSKVEIGNHCWIGLNSLILKDAKVPDNSIVGAGSIVTKKFEEDNIVLAGNPARIVRKNVEWFRQNCSSYEIDQKQKEVRCSNI